MRAPDARGSTGAAVMAAMAVAVWPGPAAATEPVPTVQLEQVERALQDSRERRKLLESEADAARREADLLRERLIAAAAEAQALEREATRLEDRVAALGRDAAAKAEALEQRRQELEVTLQALARLSRTPPQAMLGRPQSAVETLRSSLLLGHVVPELEARARALKSELAGLAELRRQVAAEQSSLAGTVAALATERSTLDRLLGDRARAEQQATAESREEARRAARLGAEARDLRSLLERLAEAERRRAEEESARAEAERRQRLAAERQRELAEAARRQAAEREQAKAAPPQSAVQDGAPAERRPGEEFALLAPPMPPAPDEGGRLPAAGRIVTAFGTTNENGVATKGITIETRAGAPVVSPAAGKVLFAGPFRGYGQLLIIAHAGGYHTLMAGFARIDGTVGRSLLAGEPIGQMGGSDGHDPMLYVELRQKGEPINPVPWLMASERKVSG